MASALFATDVKVHLIDGDGTPVAQAEVKVFYLQPIQEHDVTVKGLSDGDGDFKASSGYPPMGMDVRAKKEGYYSIDKDRLSPKQDHDLTLVMRARKNPIALYARHVELSFPVQGEWLGYDFMAGDWVAPYGKGEHKDMLIKFSHRYLGWKPDSEEMLKVRRINAGSSEDELKYFYGKWDATLDISFPSKQEGLVEESERFLDYSVMKLPNEAPESGYVPTLTRKNNTYSPTNTRSNVGFFIRTRVKLENGEIKEANYAKVVGDFDLDARGKVRFTYYFNPKPNDRNLEFDLDKNLFEKLNIDNEVHDP
jgi:hypothetical protein